MHNVVLPGEISSRIIKAETQTKSLAVRGMKSWKIHDIKSGTSLCLTALWLFSRERTNTLCVLGMLVWFTEVNVWRPMAVAGWLKAWVCGRSLDGTAGLNPAGGMDICQLWVLCALSGKSLCDGPIPRREESYWYGVSVCDLETSAVRWPRPSMSVASQEINVCREY